MKRQFVCGMHRLMSVGLLVYLLIIRFYLDLCVCCCCNLNLFYDCSESVVSVLGTTKHSQCSCIDTGNTVVLRRECRR